MNKLQIRILTHGLFWLSMSYLSASVLVGYVPVATIALRTLFILAINGILAYTNMLWLVPEWLQKGKYVGYCAMLLAVMVPLIFLRFWIEPALFSGTDFEQIFPKKAVPVVLFSSTMAIALISLGYALAENYFLNQSAKSELEKKHLEAETNFLRAQINPHFLFNTLNNLYTLALLQSEKTPDSILKLSQLMRFMLYDAEQKWIPVEKEIQYIHDFLALELLRFEKTMDVRFDVKWSKPEKLVGPLLFVPLVENALKFADLARNPNGKIHMNLSEGKENQLVFEVVNSVGKSTEPTRNSGIGLENLKRRLSIIYPNRHTLEIRNQPDLFSVTLSIQLSL